MSTRYSKSFFAFPDLDHTTSSNSATFSRITEIYKIPILFYHPNGLIAPRKEKRIFQQLDIMPTVLDLLNVEKEIYCYGKSYFENAEPEAITYLDGSYYYFSKNHLLSFSNEKVKNIYNTFIRQKDNPDSLQFLKKESRVYEKKLKAIIQRYNRDMILNQMQPNNK